MESCLCFILLAEINSIEMLACFFLWTRLHTSVPFNSGSLWYPESSGRLFSLKSPLSWGCIVVVAHKCPVNEILGHSELKLGQNNISCPWCCCFTYEEFGSRDRLWIYSEVGTSSILLVSRTLALQFKLFQLTNSIGFNFSRDRAPSAGRRCFKHFPKNQKWRKLYSWILICGPLLGFFS